MIRFFTKYRFLYLSAMATGVLILLLLHGIRYDSFKPLRALADSENYVPNNHEIHIYTGTPLKLRGDANFVYTDNVVGELNRGDLYVPFADVETQKYEVWNAPSSNVRFYQFQRIKVLEGGEYITRYALHAYHSYLEHNVDKTKEHFQTIHGLYEKSETFAAYVFNELRMCGWSTNAADAFHCESYGYIGGGYYYTTIVEDVKLYDTTGEEIGELPNGSKVYFSPNMPLSVGVNNPRLFRIIGYDTDEANGNISKRRTFFIDGFHEDGSTTIHTDKISINNPISTETSNTNKDEMGNFKWVKRSNDSAS